MQRKRTMKCSPGQHRFTVVVVNGDPHDSHSGRSFSEAYELAMPDPGSRVEVWQTCAEDGGFARLPASYRKGELVRSFRAKGGR